MLENCETLAGLATLSQLILIISNSDLVGALMNKVSDNERIRCLIKRERHDFTGLTDSGHFSHMSQHHGSIHTGWAKLNDATVHTKIYDFWRI